MRISLELVPRDKNHLIEDLRYARENIPGIDTINIPDLLKFPIRSWEGCIYAKDYFRNTIPHIRAIDYEEENKLCRLVDFLIKNEIEEILIIRGDVSPDLRGTINPGASLELIKKIKSEIRDIKIYAAVDPYRNEIKKEMDYLKEKIDAGADGFFSQPFFDLRLLEIYADALRGFSVFWGVSPVITKKSREYWESRNRAYFPTHFESTMEWNILFARKVIRFCEENGFNLYFMPIRVDLRMYLNGIFNKHAPSLYSGQAAYHRQNILTL